MRHPALAAKRGEFPIYSFIYVDGPPGISTSIAGSASTTIRVERSPEAV